VETVVSTPLILAGDVGGTKTILALFEPTSSGVRQVRDAVFHSGAGRSFDDMVTEFLGPESGALHAACFGVAGPVIGGRAQITNLPWLLDEAALAALTKAPRVKLLNDLEATAYGVLFLRDEDRGVLNAGTTPERKSNIAVIAAGTGLGEALLYTDGTHFHPVASEGGHADFAPRTDEEIELLRYLRGRFRGHVSYERVLSGPGIYNIYCFLRDAHGAPEPAWLAENLASGDRSATIAESGVAGSDPLCVKTLELFSVVYGAEAGNLALKCLALGGVFVAGGIAPKILPVLRNGSFMRGFTDKGRFAPLVERLPVSVSLNPRTALLGAAHFALRR
jgi:glucokinase